MASILDTHPHAGQPVLEAGKPLDRANVAVILLHGRGSHAAGILRLADDLGSTTSSDPTIAFMAPQALHNTWYPYRFLEPVERNEPYLSSALRRIDELIDRAVDAGVNSRNVLIVGFSQGACLALEYVARGTRDVAGAAGLAGGLIGDPTAERGTMPDLAGKQVFIGCGDLDGHISLTIAQRSADLLAIADADVDFRVYPGIDHRIVPDEIDAVRRLIRSLPM